MFFEEEGYDMKKIRVSVLLIIMTLVVVSPTFAGTNARRMSLREKAIDPDISIEAEAIEENTVPLKKSNDFILRSSKSSYSKVRSTVKLVSLAGNQWAVNAKSMARDESGLPYEIDSIYVKGSLYTKDDNGNIEYKIGESQRESNSADVMAEKMCGIESNMYYAYGYHKYMHSGYETIIHRNKDYR